MAVLTAVSLQGLDVAGGAADVGRGGRDGAVLPPHPGGLGEGDDVEAVVGAQGAEDGLHGRLGLRAREEWKRGHAENRGPRGVPSRRYLLDFGAGHGAADVDEEDDVFWDGRQPAGREEVDEVPVV